jgi:hypothetical protein
MLSLTSREETEMAIPSPGRWARLIIPGAMIVVGLGFRLAGVPGWSTLLLLGGIISGALVAYVILLGEHERPVVTDHVTEELKAMGKSGSSQDLRFPGRHDRGYDGR